jgi:ribosomal-protein-alanine N-acetyltransferase
VVRLEQLNVSHTEEVFAAVERSRDLHRPWMELPATREGIAELLAAPSALHLRYGVREPGGALAGSINVNSIIRGAFQNGFIGYCAFTPFAGQGFMREGLRTLVTIAFEQHQLHRLEINMQPENVRSVRLAQAVGFRYEGHSPRYLRIGDAWRDHDRYALTVEEWRR